MAGRLKVCGIAAAPVVAVVHFQPEARPVVAAVPALHQGRHSGTLSHRRVILDRLLKGQPRYQSSFLHLSIIVVCMFGAGKAWAKVDLLFVKNDQIRHKLS